MLIEFSVGNFRSVRERQTLSMAASASADLRDSNTFSTDIKALPRLLLSAILYGPNAGGKSNLVKAFHVMQWIVLNSQAQQQGQVIPVVPFRLSSEMAGKPSEFEVHIIQDGVRYQYGFAASTERVHSEWLIAYPQGRPQRWFDRAFNTETGADEYEFSPLFHGGTRRQLLKETTRGNALFLSTAIQLNNEQLRPLFSWFKDRLAVVLPGAQFRQDFSLRMFEEEGGHARMMDFMTAADINIAGIEVQKKNFGPEMLPPDMPEPIREVILRDLQDKKMVNIRIRHLGEGGEVVEFGLGDESDGTQKLFWIAGPWMDVLVKGRVLVIDELDTHLHPLLVRFLVSLMHGSGTNPKNAQLLSTTQNTSLLDDDSIRRDQFWFVEKKADNSTSVYPLTDFHPRKKEALERGYLKGRYGALPIIRKGMRHGA